MNILHIAFVSGNRCSGVSNVVPLHVINQAKYENVALLNLICYQPNGNFTCFVTDGSHTLENLPVPFNSPDLVVFHEIYHIEYVKLAKWLSARNIPYVIVPHGCLRRKAQRKKWFKKLVANALVFDSFVCGCLGIQCLADDEKNELIYRRVNSFVGTNGCSLPETRKTQFGTDGLVFTFIGRLDAYHKGLDLMLAAIKSAHDLLKSHNCRFYIYGPDYKGRFENVARLIVENDVGDIVSLNHEVFGADKLNALMNADVFIQTSRFEGMPLGVLEAFSYGIPCLLTKGTNLSGYAKSYNAGWECDATVESIAAAIAEAVSCTDLEIKSQNAVNIIKDNFNWEKAATDELAEYRRLLCIKNSVPLKRK